MSSVYPTPLIECQYLMSACGDTQTVNPLFKPVEICFTLIDKYPYILLVERREGGCFVERIRLDSEVSLDFSATSSLELLRLSLTDRRTLTVKFQKRENTLKLLPALKEKIILSTFFFPSNSLSPSPTPAPHGFEFYIPKRTISATSLILSYNSAPYTPPAPLYEINGNLQIVRSLRPPMVSPIAPNFLLRLNKLYRDYTEIRLVRRDGNIDFGFKFSATSPYTIDRGSNTIQLISIESRESCIYLYRTHRENIERFECLLKAEVAKETEESSLTIEAAESLASSRAEESIAAYPELISVEFVRQNQHKTNQGHTQSASPACYTDALVEGSGSANQTDCIDLYRRSWAGNEREIPLQFHAFDTENCPFDSSDSFIQTEDCLYSYQLIDANYQLITLSPTTNIRKMHRIGTPQQLNTSTPSLFCQDPLSGDFIITKGEYIHVYSVSLDESLHTRIEKACEFEMTISPYSRSLLPTKLEFLTPTSVIVLGGGNAQGLYTVDLTSRRVRDEWALALAGQRVLDFCIERSAFKKRATSKRVFVLTDRDLYCLRPGESSLGRVTRDQQQLARRNPARIRWLGRGKVLLISPCGRLSTCSVGEGSVEDLEGLHGGSSGFSDLVSADFKRLSLLVTAQAPLYSAIDLYEFCIIIASHSGIEVFELPQNEGQVVAKTGEYKTEGRVIGVGVGKRHYEYIVVEPNRIYILHNHH